MTMRSNRVDVVTDRAAVYLPFAYVAVNSIARLSLISTSYHGTMTATL